MRKLASNLMETRSFRKSIEIGRRAKSARAGSVIFRLTSIVESRSR